MDFYEERNVEKNFFFWKCNVENKLCADEMEKAWYSFLCRTWLRCLKFLVLTH